MAEGMLFFFSCEGLTLVTGFSKHLDIAAQGNHGDEILCVPPFSPDQFFSEAKREFQYPYIKILCDDKVPQLMKKNQDSQNDEKGEQIIGEECHILSPSPKQDLFNIMHVKTIFQKFS